MIATPTGWSPTAIEPGRPSVPSPLPGRMLTVPAVSSLLTTTSNVPSLFTSPAAISPGSALALKGEPLAGVRKAIPPPATPRNTPTLPLPVLAIARSAMVSPLKSAVVMPSGFVPPVTEMMPPLLPPRPSP